MTKGSAAFLEFVSGLEAISPGRLFKGTSPSRVLAREDLISIATPELKQWIDWAEPGEAYQSKRDRGLYLCVQLTVGD